MSTIDIGVGSISDKLNAITTTLKGCSSLAAVESRYAQIGVGIVG
jgi:hypothetical protein